MCKGVGKEFFAVQEFGHGSRSLGSLGSFGHLGRDMRFRKFRKLRKFRKFRKCRASGAYMVLGKCRIWEVWEV